MSAARLPVVRVVPGAPTQASWLSRPSVLLLLSLAAFFAVYQMGAGGAGVAMSAAAGQHNGNVAAAAAAQGLSGAPVLEVGRAGPQRYLCVAGGPAPTAEELRALSSSPASSTSGEECLPCEPCPRARPAAATWEEASAPAECPACEACLEPAPCEACPEPAPCEACPAPPEEKAAPPAAASVSSSGDASLADYCATVTEEELARVVGESVQARARYQGWGGPPFTAASLANLHPCMRRGDLTYSVKEDVLFIMLAGTLTIDRVRAFRETWGKGMDNIIVMGDAADPSVGMITLPVLEGRPARVDAPHRTLQALIYAANNREYDKYRWIFMVDDDTWVNTRELPSLLFGWDTRAPIMTAFFWNNPNFLGGRTWPSGGSGMLVTRAAAKRLAAQLYSETCPFDMENDRTLGYCALRTGVAMLHSALFDPEAAHTIICDKSPWQWQANDGDIRTMIAIHRADPARMREWQGVVDRYPEDTALAEKPHPKAPVGGK
jgi:hypothetical protein